MNEREYFVIGVDAKELKQATEEMTKEEFLTTLADFQLNVLLSMLALGFLDCRFNTAKRPGPS